MTTTKTILAAPGSDLGPGRPPTEDDHAGDDPPPGKNWVRFDFPPGSTPEQIARVLIARHSDGDDGDA